jgi:hypothetical protein
VATANEGCCRCSTQGGRGQSHSATCWWQKRACLQGSIIMNRQAVRSRQGQHKKQRYKNTPNPNTKSTSPRQHDPQHTQHTQAQHNNKTTATKHINTHTTKCTNKQRHFRSKSACYSGLLQPAWGPPKGGWPTCALNHCPLQRSRVSQALEQAPGLDPRGVARQKPGELNKFREPCRALWTRLWSLPRARRCSDSAQLSWQGATLCGP